MEIKKRKDRLSSRLDTTLKNRLEDRYWKIIQSITYGNEEMEDMKEKLWDKDSQM